MCGRFTNQYTWRELIELYRITEPCITPISNLEPRFNFAPMQRGLRTDDAKLVRLMQQRTGACLGHWRRRGYLKSAPERATCSIGRSRNNRKPNP